MKGMTSSVFAGEVIEPLANGQRVTDSKVTIERAISKWGPWNDIRTDTYQKTLYPPNGYRYVFDHTTKYESDPKIVKHPILGFSAWERKVTVKYYYRLVRL